MKKVKRQPNIKLKDIQEAVHKKYNLSINAGKASRARDKAKEYVDGAYTQQYNQLWEYCEELKRSSPGSTILMKVHTFNDGDLAAKMDLLCGVPYFERLYILCRDPNEEYFSLAYVVVEVETKDFWTWFINLLLADIGQNKRWVFMSDQQKYEHRICCKHLYNNFRKNHPGVLIREMFWKAAKATYKQEFVRVMDELKEIDVDAHSWLDAHSTTKWVRHMFSGAGLTDTILKNMCESFNSRILKFRSKPIISMCIKLYLMTRFQENKEKGVRLDSNICAKVMKRLHKEKLAANRWLACWVGQTQFEVKNGLQSFTVDLATEHCSCRKCDISGIPYAYAISCIFFNKQDAEQYVHPCYHVSTYKACYEPIISPINGQNMWRPSGVTLVQPPIKRRPLGRPKKKRAREPNEPTSRRAGISKQCKACDQQNQGSLSHTRCTLPVQHAQVQARCTTLGQDKLNHTESWCTSSLQQQQPKSKDLFLNRVYLHFVFTVDLAE
ncbi:uncharacterized protein LOC142630989 [Castanea sativa]|uniref:uncharacterized protein LOC142630989 n=1 Tax=Castanea sativa TaxID=21020 RepID=UPI003F6523EB